MHHKIMFNDTWEYEGDDGFIQRYTPCPICKGTKITNDGDRCYQCNHGGHNIPLTGQRKIKHSNGWNIQDDKVGDVDMADVDEDQ